MSGVLCLRSLGKRYGRTVGLHGLSLSVQAGSVYGLLGPNGSGKSTALHVLTGILRATSGDVLVQGIPIEDKRSRSHVGFAPDDLPLPQALTGQEYLDFHAAVHARHDAALVSRLVRVFDIRDALDQPLVSYSHGMKRKIQVIAAVAHVPDLLILDEPFRGLDPGAAALLRSLIQSFAEGGRAVLIATHDMLRAERDCDVVNILCDGSSVAEGRPAELVARAGAGATLEDVFLSVTGATARVRDFSHDMMEVLDGA